jgi:hypothetical protein
VSDSSGADSLRLEELNLIANLILFSCRFCPSYRIVEGILLAISRASRPYVKWSVRTHILFLSSLAITENLSSLLLRPLSIP